MSEMGDVTPIDRPLLLSDLNDIKRIVNNIETVQLRWYQESQALTQRVALLERRLWWPTFIGATAAAVAFVSAVLARFPR